MPVNELIDGMIQDSLCSLKLVSCALTGTLHLTSLLGPIFRVLSILTKVIDNTITNIVTMGNLKITLMMSLNFFKGQY